MKFEPKTSWSRVKGFTIRSSSLLMSKNSKHIYTILYSGSCFDGPLAGLCVPRLKQVVPVPSDGQTGGTAWHGLSPKWQGPFNFRAGTARISFRVVPAPWPAARHEMSFSCLIVPGRPAWPASTAVHFHNFSPIVLKILKIRKKI